MHIPTHILSGWCIANHLDLTPRERTLAMAAAGLADLDGLGLLVSVDHYAAYHHVLAHNLTFGLLLTSVLTFFSTHRVKAAVLYLALFHLHLVMDYYGSGPGWGIEYLWPFADLHLESAHAWELTAWQNYLAFVILLFWTCGIIWVKHRTPLEVIAPRLDEMMVKYWSLPPLPTLPETPRDLGPVALPMPDEAMRRMQALAALDLILSPEFQYRYYSFNAHWAPGMRMASMRNGMGDEWWMVQHASGWGALKGLNHESEAWDGGRTGISAALQARIPMECKSFAAEPAFCWDTTSFAYVCHPEARAWTRLNDETDCASLDAGEHELLEVLTAPPEHYVAFAAEYFEKEIPLEVVRHVYALRPLTQEIVSALNPGVVLEDISTELYDQIGYPR